ncbi:MAG: hypothetical protein NTV98_06045 [Candidatus Roizmanbacteria bacterium]|nr:hypothetical protein [Candidatus Roizmanbacteria bacterium]
METQCTVRLYGELAEQFGDKEHTMLAKDMVDVVRGLISNFGVQFKHVFANGVYQIVLGEKHEDYVTEKDKLLSEKLIQFPIKEQYVHIFPAVQGAGGGGNQILFGFALVALAFVTAGASLAVEGAFVTATLADAGSMAVATFEVMSSSTVLSSLAIAGALSMVGGIMSLFVPVPKMNYSVAQRQSFIFGGPVNNTHQGGAVPIIYGECMTGSTVISASIQTANVNWNMLTYEQVMSGVQY